MISLCFRSDSDLLFRSTIGGYSCFMVGFWRLWTVIFSLKCAIFYCSYLGFWSFHWHGFQLLVHMISLCFRSDSDLLFRSTMGCFWCLIFAWLGLQVHFWAWDFLLFISGFLKFQSKWISAAGSYDFVVFQIGFWFALQIIYFKKQIVNSDFLSQMCDFLLFIPGFLKFQSTWISAVGSYDFVVFQIGFWFALQINYGLFFGGCFCLIMLSSLFLGI